MGENAVQFGGFEHTGDAGSGAHQAAPAVMLAGGGVEQDEFASAGAVNFIGGGERAGHEAAAAASARGLDAASHEALYDL